MAQGPNQNEFMCVTLSCEDKQMKTHRLNISSYSPIDDLSLQVVTKTTIILQKKVYYFIHSILSSVKCSTVALQDKVENHLCN